MFSWLPAFIFLICMFCCLFYISYHCYTQCLQCFNAVGWVAGRASGLWKTEWWGAGRVVCLKWVADLHMAQLMPLLLTISCFSKIQIGFTFLVPAHPGSHGKGPLNVCVCACVRACVQYPLLLTLLPVCLLRVFFNKYSNTQNITVFIAYCIVCRRTRYGSRRVGQKSWKKRKVGCSAPAWLSTRSWTSTGRWLRTTSHWPTP